MMVMGVVQDEAVEVVVDMTLNGEMLGNFTMGGMMMWVV